ncbi:hypothetical protein HUB98_29115 [Paenibacillus barcinonensis]|uniref:Uncharacterized protein n=1 Tax=Paenibacillus barcinonensis TaxID=198119 RepID=A0A2V4VL35_PAEBA|nr:hypothetical protein [Paenibacillus barcinonensis]PYE50135.1 hypothetical protein DFQ00_10493 [Paenibacillus barcinonensis]QKS59866.1 hypothetical protein HUB98_29115 [Paenibacillus barcinonensis]
MSRDDVHSLLADLKEGHLLGEQNFRGLDVDAYLDERDEALFADEWMRAYERYAGDAALAEQEVLRNIRETAFKRTITLTGEPELAGYVSDDFGLIGCYLLQKEEQNDFVWKLFGSYRLGKLPLCS